MVLFFWFLSFYPLSAALGTVNEINSNWSISEDLKISPAEDLRLHKRTPRIENQSNVQIILTSLALRHAFTKLWVDAASGQWTVHGTKGQAISQINFSLAPLALLNDLRATVSPYVGQVHTDVLLARISQEVEAQLGRLGYQSAKVKTQTTKSSDGIEYQFELDIGNPCIVSGYKWEHSPPIVIDQSLRPGDLCTDAGAKMAVSETEIKARNAGYIDANLTFIGFEFQNHSSKAVIIVGGIFGPKTVYEFVDQGTGRNLSSVFSNSDMQAFDPAILSPESVNFELARQLKIRGFSKPEISSTETSLPENGSVVYTFSVLMGDRTTISRLQVEGNMAVTTAEILSLLEIERPSQVDGQISDVIFNSDALAAGVERIRVNYVNRGFWDVKVMDRQIESRGQAGQTSRVSVVVTIEEGDRRIFQSAKIVGNSAVPISEISDLITWNTGVPLIRSDIIELQQKIRSLYAVKGYFYTAVVGEANSLTHESGQIETMVVIRIDEGPRVHFGDVFITGLLKTDPKVVMRELYFDTGEWYDPELVSLSRLALLKIGVFGSAVIRPLDPDIAFKQSTSVDLLIQVTESPSRVVSFGPGWSSFNGFRYNLEGALTNIGGMGRQLFARASFDEETNQKAIGPKTLVGRAISAGYLEPYAFDSPFAGTVSLAQSARATEYAWSLTRSGELELSHKLKAVIPGSKISLFYTKKLNDEAGSREAIDAFLADTFAVGRIGFRFFLDKRNDPVWTSTGFTLGSELSWARYELGGDVRYFRWEFSNNHYFSMLKDWVLALGINFASFEDVERLGQSKIDVLPASERLPTGGADSVRGFRERSLGPIVRRPTLTSAGVWDCGYSASPTGGSSRLILKAESRYRFTADLAGTLFLDSGTSSFSRDEMRKFQDAFSSAAPAPNTAGCIGSPNRSIEDNEGYELAEVVSDPKTVWNRNYTSFGTAINWLTPIGSINLAYGIPWHEPKSRKCVSDSTYCFPRSDQSVPLWRRGEVHFNVGSKF